jgi:hypothetical protein
MPEGGVVGWRAGTRGRGPDSLVVGPFVLTGDPAELDRAAAAWAVAARRPGRGPAAPAGAAGRVGQAGRPGRPRAGGGRRSSAARWGGLPSSGRWRAALEVERVADTGAYPAVLTEVYTGPVRECVRMPHGTEGRTR